MGEEGVVGGVCGGDGREGGAPLPEGEGVFEYAHVVDFVEGGVEL